MPFGKVAPPYGFPGSGGFGGGCFGGGMPVFGIIIMALFFIFIVGLIAMGARMMRRRGMMMMHGGLGAGDPLEIAKMRYARGEISAEEFETIKKNLS